MATYVVGDVHGCLRTLERLLLTLPFSAGRDRLWLTGDLVNRGPASLEVLRWAEASSRAMGERFVSVLGNHDLHLLASAAGAGKPWHREAFESVLAAPDRDFLVDWLARRPLLHRQDSVALVHAGFLPAWTLDEASERAAKLETRLRDPHRRVELLQAAAKGEADPDLWAFTRLRMLDASGRPSPATCSPEKAPVGHVPWFQAEGRRSSGEPTIAGHWSALGLRITADFLGLDTGCVYGGELTAVRLEDREVFSVPNAEEEVVEIS